MRFAFTDDQTLFADGLRDLLAKECTPARVRAAWDDGTGHDAALSVVLPNYNHGKLIEQWTAIKSAALDAVIEGGGTVTHHHSVGRDHRAWYDRQRPPLFAAALRAAKRELDPQGLLNPGILIDPL